MIRPENLRNLQAASGTGTDFPGYAYEICANPSRVSLDLIVFEGVHTPPSLL